jgi:EAL domain-containing protein (putative c-di-GMP-specific phosphodiesterase class I)/FixJ family two-component response regulator
MSQNAVSDYRVLLVDDEPFIRGMTARLLKDIGCTQFLEAGNGHEALAILDAPETHVDLVLCDLAMPDMDGVEIVRHLANRPQCPALAFLSGSDSGVLRAAEALARAYGLRTLGTLSKPATKDGLRAILTEISAEYRPKKRDFDLGITEAELARGIAASELCLHYQPKVRIDTGALDSVEALVRWNHPTHGLVPPDMFVPLSEASGLIGPMTERLVDIGFRQLGAWRTQGFTAHMGINLSPSMLSDVTLPDRFAALAAGLTLDPKAIVFEITETGVAKEEAIYLEIVTRLHMKGFALSIDDFGTGQSSMQKLEALPFHELKVDRQFVHGAHKNPAKRAILQASLTLAGSLGMKTVAEGVEHREDWDLLKELGCNVVQGFLVSRPLPHADVLPRWMSPWPGA